MPTPSESLPTPPLEPQNIRCPPDDNREQREAFGRDRQGSETPELSLLTSPTSDAQERREEVEERYAEGGAQLAGTEQDDQLRQEDTPEADEEGVRIEPQREKREHVELRSAHTQQRPQRIEANTQAESPAELAHALSATAISPTEAEERVQYAYFPSSRHRLLPSHSSSHLRPGSKFRGTQQSDRQVYDVQVEIKDVDMSASFLCGYLRIQGLTDDHPTLTTFFEGEILDGVHHTYRTAHPSWGSTEKIDLQHWARFPVPLSSETHLFMRWKEYFLVPDHRVKTITGASFEGFYYICFERRGGGVSGIYFHAKSEKFQQLELRWVGDGGCAGAVEFV